MTIFSITTHRKQLREEKTSAEEIESELKLLEWHKLANDAALKAALVRTKKLKKKDVSPDRVKVRVYLKKSDIL